MEEFQVFKTHLVIRDGQLVRSTIVETKLPKEQYEQFQWDKINRLDFAEEKCAIFLANNKLTMTIFCTAFDQVVDIINNGFLKAEESKEFTGELIDVQ